MEGSWSSSVRDVRTVRPVLQALGDAGAAKHAELRVNDPGDLRRELTRWGQAQHKQFGIGYLAFTVRPERSTSVDAGWTCSSSASRWD